MSSEPEATSPDPTPEGEFTVVTVKRGVNIQRWIWAGVVIGAIAAFLSAVLLPPTEGYSRMQTFGFFLVFFAALGGVIVTAIGLIVNIFVSRGKGRQVVLRRVAETEAEADVDSAAEPEAPAADAAHAAPDADTADEQTTPSVDSSTSIADERPASDRGSKDS